MADTSDKLPAFFILILLVFLIVVGIKKLKPKGGKHFE